MDRESPLHYAVRNGNLKIIQLLVETGKANAKLVNYVDFDPLCLTFGMDLPQELKLEIVKFLLPYTYTEHPTKPGYFSIFEILKPTVLCSRRGNNLISQFFIQNFYKYSYNSRFPLIEMLEKYSENSHLLCAFIHDEIVRYDQYYCQLFRHLNIEAHIINVILELISKNDHDCLETAIDTTRLLLTINFDSFLKEEFLYQHPPDFQIFLSNFKDVPTPQQIFRFTYKLLNPETEPKIFDLLLACLTVCDTSNTNMFRTTIQILMPFVVKDYHFAAVLQECNNRGFLHEIEEYVPHTIIPFMMRNLYRMPNNVSTLKTLCRDAVRRDVGRNKSTSKEFIKTMLGLDLPVSLKCYLLHICDGDWIKDLID